MGGFKTVFGSLDDYVPGEIDVLDDDPRNYVFSNVFDVASRSAPYEKIVVGRSLEYVIETLRAEGTSPWFAASHDEFALVLDGTVRIDLVRLDEALPAETAGSLTLRGSPRGRKMGFMRLRRGHQGLLPAGAAYRFTSEDRPGVIVLQTRLGPHSVQKWPEICRT